MQITENYYGDTVITYDEKHNMPCDVNYHANRCVMMTHVPDKFEQHLMPHTLGECEKYGKIVGNDFARSTFPWLQNNHLQGISVVLFTIFNDKTYYILVQPKNRDYLMTLSSYTTVNDLTLFETVQKCAKRQLNLDIFGWIPFCEWEYNANFASLELEADTVCGLAYVKTIPLEWQEKIQSDVTLINVNNDTIANVVLVEIQNFANLVNMASSLPMHFAVHHHYACLLAANLQNLISKEDIESVNMDLSYLNSFHFYEQVSA